MLQPKVNEMLWNAGWVCPYYFAEAILVIICEIKWPFKKCMFSRINFPIILFVALA